MEPTVNTFALRGRRFAFAAVAPLIGLLSFSCAGGTTEAPAYTGDPYVVPSAVNQGGDVAQCRNTSECSGVDAGTCKHARCVEGACVVMNDQPGAICDEPNGELGECQAARCDSAGACVASTALDGAVCGELDTCTRSVCTGGVCGTPVTRDCDDGDPCTTDSCNPTTGCEWTANTSACDDGDPCTSGDACNAAGLCQGAPSCECKTDGDCISKDKNKCDGTSKCVENKCVNDAATAVDCSSLVKDLEMCESVECNVATGTCEVSLEEYKLCDDGNACTTGEYCNAAGACIVKTVVCESNCEDDTNEDGDADTDCDDIDCENDSACVE